MQKKTSENNNSLNNSTKNSTNYTSQQQNSTKSTSTQDSLINKSKEVEKETVQLVPTLPVVLNDSVTKQNGHIVNNNDADVHQQQTCDHSSENSIVEKAPSRPGKKNRAKQALLHNPEDNQNEHQHCDCYTKLEAEAKKLKNEFGSLKSVSF